MLGTRLAGYSPVGDTISALATIDAATRVGMTAGFVALGAGLVPYASALRDTVPGPAWVAAAVVGASSFAVAALPLPPDGSSTAHAVAAAVGYVGLAAVPLLAAAPLGRRCGARWVVASRWAGVVCGASLIASTLGPASGLAQRVGLTVGHGWIAATAVTLLRDRARAN